MSILSWARRILGIRDPEPAAPAIQAATDALNPTTQGVPVTPVGVQPAHFAYNYGRAAHSQDTARREREEAARREASRREASRREASRREASRRDDDATTTAVMSATVLAATTAEWSSPSIRTETYSSEGGSYSSSSSSSDSGGGGGGGGGGGSD